MTSPEPLSVLFSGRRVQPAVWFGILAIVAMGLSAPARCQQGDFLSDVRAPEGRSLSIRKVLLFLYLGPLKLEQFVAAENKKGLRSDKQGGAGSKAAGATTLVEKPSAADLISFAIERGAIEKTDSGTSFTLHTTPYLFLTKFGALDDPEHWQRLAAIRRLSLAATFRADGQDLGKGLRNFESGTAQYVLRGDRSKRDPAFVDQFNKAVVTRLSPVQVKFTGECAAFLNLLGEANLAILDKAEANLKDGLQRSDATDALLKGLQTDLQAIVLTKDQSLKLATCAEAGLAAERAFKAVPAKLAEEVWNSLPKSPLELSASYTYARDATAGDSSRLKVLMDYKAGQTSKLSLNLNAEVALNNRRAAPDGSQLDRVKDYGGEVALSYGRFGNDRFDFSLGTKYKQIESGRFPTWLGQAKLDVYLDGGVAIPLALTYASRTETSSHSQVTFNVGVGALGDALLGIAQKR